MSDVDALSIAGAHLVRGRAHVDERGTFVRLFEAEVLRAAGLDARIEQVSLSANPHVATLRGLHVQDEPAPQTKVVRVLRGRAFDVLVDVRPGSPTELTWYGVELSADNLQALCVPPGVAHGFLTLEPDTEILYSLSAPQVPEAERGFRWDDPRLDIEWPRLPQVLSDRDRSFPLLGDA